MRCLVTGAYGFIGSSVCRALLDEGAEVVGAGRDLALGRRLLPDIEWVHCDFNKDLDPEIWRLRLENIDAVINCAGVLQSTFRDDLDNIHNRSAVALFQAASAAGVKRAIQISAISAEADIETDYSTSKVATDRALNDIDVNYVIVKPSLVLGAGSHGGMSLVRGLAGSSFCDTAAGAGEPALSAVGRIRSGARRGAARLPKRSGENDIVRGRSGSTVDGRYRSCGAVMARVCACANAGCTDVSAPPGSLGWRFGRLARFAIGHAVHLARPNECGPPLRPTAFRRCHGS